MECFAVRGDNFRRLEPALVLADLHEGERPDRATRRRRPDRSREPEDEGRTMTRRAASGLNRRRFLKAASLFALLPPTNPAWADAFVNLNLPGGPDQRSITTAFPEKGRMILQRSRPPLLETPFEVFDRGVFTPNDQFFVRWHWAVIPNAVDADTFRLAVRGHVNQVLSLSLQDILSLPRVEMAAVNQCSGNSRGLFLPRVAGGQWGNG